MYVGVNFEGPYDWNYYITDSQIRASFDLFKAQGITKILILNQWSVFQSSNNPVTYNAANTANHRRVLTIAQEYGIRVCYGFFQYFQAGSQSGTPLWCTTGGARHIIAIVRDAAIRQQFINYVKHFVNEFKSFSCIDSWATLNEPMHGQALPDGYTITREKEDFQTLIEDLYDAVHSIDARPVYVRFTLPYSSWHTRTSGAGLTFVDFNRMLACNDVMSLNIYGDPTNDNASWESVNWNIFEDAAADIRASGKPFWISEFGVRSSDLGEAVADQRFAAYLTRFHAQGVDEAFAWAWVYVTSSEPYNVWNRAANRPYQMFNQLGDFGVPVGTLSVTASLNGEPLQAPIMIGTSGPFTTPYSNELNIGVYTVKCTYDSEMQTQYPSVSAERETIINFPFIREEPPPPPPPPVQIPCPFCDLTFTSETALASHIRNVHPEQKTFPCPFCTLVFNSETELGTHITAMHFPVVPPQTFPCPYCDLTFNSEAELKAHIDAVHMPVAPPPEDGHCFIATASGLDNPSLAVLRRFRDRKMRPSMVALYYRLSPSFASAISNHNLLKTIPRKVFEWLAARLKNV